MSRVRQKYHSYASSRRWACGKRRVCRVSVETLEDRLMLAGDTLTYEAPVVSSGGEQLRVDGPGLPPGRTEDPPPLVPPLTSTYPGPDFDTIGIDSGFRFIPPDPHGAVGPAHTCAVVNVVIQCHTKAGAPVLTDSLADFFSPLGDGLGGFPDTPLDTFTFDPKVIYDQYEDRFVVVTLEQTDATDGGGATDESHILVAVSDTSDPTGTWSYLDIDSKTSISGVDNWADYPGFAVDEEAVYITNNMFSFGAAPSFGGVRLWIIDKGVVGGLYGGGPASFTVHDPYAATTTGFPITTQPAHVFDGGGGVGPGIGTFLVSYSGLTNGVDEFVQIVRVDDPLGATSFTPAEFLNVGNIDANVAVLPDAPQLGSAALIEVNDRRALNAVWRDDGLWLGATVEPAAGPDAGQTTAHWFKLDTSAVTSSASPAGLITLGDQGNVGGEAIAAGASTFFPSVMVDSVGNMGIGFSVSAPTIYASSAFTGRLVTDAPGTTQPESILAAGTDYYVRTFGGARNRWGDYSGIALDPTDETTFCAFNERATTRGTVISGEDGRWATDWGCFSLASDFGDAPDLSMSGFAYETSLAGSFGTPASHALIPAGPTLGPTVDPEPDGQPTLLADGDDVNLLYPGLPDDEDGVALAPSYTAGAGGSVTVDGGAVGGLLDAWIDFDGSGTFDDPAEHLFGGSVPVAPGPGNVLPFVVPAAAVTGSTYGRFRISTGGALPPSGPAPDGEVEDYAVTIVAPAATVDLAVTKTESVETVLAGSGPGNLTYVVTVANNGPGAATGVVLSETLTTPAGVTIDSITPSGSTTYAPPLASGTWTVGTLLSGASETLTVVLTVDKSAATGTDVIENTAAVTAVNETDSDPGNDSATEATSIQNGGAILLPGGVLQIVGTDNDDVITVRDVGGGQYRVRVNAPDFSALFDSALITSIEAFGCPGNDEISIRFNVDRPALINGGEGNDLIRGGSGKTTAIGGPGNDVIYGSGSDDSLFGNSGADTIRGGEGNDYINGGAGADTLFGQNGFDILLGGPGRDVVNGNAGRDVMIGGAADDTLGGGGGIDILIAGTTLYDDDRASLDLIMEEWSKNSTSLTGYNRKIDHLRNGTGVVLAGTGVRLEANVTVFDDGVGDRLLDDLDRDLAGGGGLDWFFADLDGVDGDDDLVTDLQPNEVIDLLN